MIEDLLTISDDELIKIINEYSWGKKSSHIALQNLSKAVTMLEIKLQIAEDAAARKEKILSALETTAKWKRGLNNGNDNSNNNN